MELNFKKIPKKDEVLKFMDSLMRVFFPELHACHDKDLALIKAKSRYLTGITNDVKKQDEFFREVLALKDVFEKDMIFTFEGDPSCDALEEIVSSYPGYTATCYHRIAHILYKQDLKIYARLISEEAHFKTGIDIHPGAVIGECFMIDHGTGIVIGETSVIGHHTKIYQGVTLGGISLRKGQALQGIKRHPTIGNYVTIYAGANILGDITIGNNVTIGANVLLTDSVESNMNVILQKPKLILKEKFIK